MSRTRALALVSLSPVDRLFTSVPPPVRVPPLAQDFDTGDIQQMEDNGSLLGVITHEMGHVIGVG